MLRELIRMWKKIGLLDKALNNFMKMIEAAEAMFHCSTDALFGVRKVADARDMIYSTDIKINKKQRKIRKELVEHLALNPRGDAPACLILMSVIKDIERAGDYCKNLLEVVDMLKDPAIPEAYAADLHEMADLVAASFNKTRQAFAEEDQTLGHEIIVEETRFAKRGDAMVERIADDDSLSPNHAVCLALAFRFLKRINAHLGNVASTVVMPLHKIDYFDEKWSTKKEEEDALRHMISGGADDDTESGDDQD
jgi:phosphate transport system protein